MRIVLLLVYGLFLLAGCFSCSLQKNVSRSHQIKEPILADNSKGKSRFILYQLESPRLQMGYVIRTKNNKIILVDGGEGLEVPHIREVLDTMGNEVEAWIISHPHSDHMGALNQIVKNPGNITIKRIIHSRLTESQIEKVDIDVGNPATNDADSCRAYYHALDTSRIPVVNYSKAGSSFSIDGVKFKILSVRNPEFEENAVNNSSMVFKVWDKEKSVLFLGDLGIEGGDKLLKERRRNDLKCDYIQMAHHGNHGVSFDFLREIKFSGKGCFWPSTKWLWNNDIGEGYDTGPFNTVRYKELMDSLGVEQHFVSWEGPSEVN